MVNWIPVVILLPRSWRAASGERRQLLLDGCGARSMAVKIDGRWWSKMKTTTTKLNDCDGIGICKEEWALNQNNRDGADSLRQTWSLSQHSSKFDARMVVSCHSLIYFDYFSSYSHMSTWIILIHKWEIVLICLYKWLVIILRRGVIAILYLANDIWV